jgi:thiol-disulfide isomerase/thioredoxin
MYKILFILFFSSAVIAAEVEPLQPLSMPRPAPAFNFPDRDGVAHTLQDYSGQVLVVNFWATWCPPCVRELPALDRLQQQLADNGVVVLGVNLGETTEDINTFLQRVVDVEFTLLLDPTMHASSEWGIRGLPTTYIIDDHGQILFEVLGDKHWDDPVIVEQIRAVTTSGN